MAPPTAPAASSPDSPAPPSSAPATRQPHTPLPPIPAMPDSIVPHQHEPILDPEMRTTARLARPYVAGGLSAMLASAVIHPIDLTKVRLQLVGEGTRGGPRPSAFSVAQNVVATQGVKGLYKGLSAALIRQATYGTARIGLHTRFTEMLKGTPNERLSMWKSFAASSAAGILGSAIGNPFDVALVRMQADGMKPVAQRLNYTGLSNALYRIVTEEGVAALWYGFPPTMLRAVAMNVGQMASYDQIKQEVAVHWGDNLSTQLVAAAGAGFFAAFFSLPFDMMKTRLQNMKKDPVTGKYPYNGVLDCGRQILAKEGVLTFWRGFGTYYGRCAPHAMIILMTREQITAAYNTTFGL